MNIGIVGAGLLGRLIAWQCLKNGHAVSIFDRDTINGEASAAHVAAAMLAPFSEAAVTGERTVFDWGLQSLEQWPALLQQLFEDSGQQVDFQQRGSVIVAHPADRTHLEHFHRQLKQHIDNNSDIVALDRSTLAQYEPALASRFNQGIFLPREACLDNWGLLAALAIAIDKRGGRWYPQCTVANVIDNTLLINGQRQLFDVVFDTRGLGAKPQLADLRGVRGEIIWAHAPEVTLSRPLRLLHPRYALYIVPKPNQCYAIGSTMIESESIAPITVRSSLELLSALYSVDSCFAEANIINSYANCRPAFSDNLPRVTIDNRVIRVNGLYRHGFLLAPYILSLALQKLIEM